MSARASQEMFICPACGKPVTGLMSFAFTLGEIRDGKADAQATVTGIRVSHDCMPQVTRDRG